MRSPCITALLVLGLAMWTSLACQGTTTPPVPPAQETSANRSPVTCPVCGLHFDRKEATATFAHGGKTYYFLVADHQQAFARDPAAYLRTGPEPEATGGTPDE